MCGGIAFRMSVRAVPRNDTIEHVDHISGYVRIGVLVNRNTGGRMRYEHDAMAAFNTAPTHNFRHFASNVNHFASLTRANREGFHTRHLLYRLCLLGIKLREIGSFFHLFEHLVRLLLELLRFLLETCLLSAAGACRLFIEILRLNDDVVVVYRVANVE